jgi:hypothetical protein
MQGSRSHALSLLIALALSLLVSRAHSQDASSRSAFFDPRSTQLYVIGGGFVPIAPTGSVGSLDMSSPPGQQSIQTGGTSAVTAGRAGSCACGSNACGSGHRNVDP